MVLIQTTFTELVVVVGNTTWEVMNARKALKTEWEQSPSKSFVVNAWGGKQTVKIPEGLESTTVHKQKMAELSKKTWQNAQEGWEPRRGI
jgi:isoquinoline 1-oxidoreductase beta subunit